MNKELIASRMEFIASEMAKLVELNKQLDQKKIEVSGQYTSLAGAKSDCEFWLKELEEKEKEPKRD